MSKKVSKRTESRELSLKEGFDVLSGKGRASKRAPASKGTAMVKRTTVGLPVAREPVSPQTLLERVINQKLPMETMERLLAMWARDQFNKAMAGFQSECAIVEKKQTATIRSRKGEDSSFSYGYAAIEDLVDAVKPLFAKYELSWTCKPKQTKESVTATVFVRHAAGHEEVTEFTVPIDPESTLSGPQEAGKALTYATRYAFRAAFGIQTRGEDNDASERSRPDITSEERAQRGGPRTQVETPLTEADMKATYDEICERLAGLPEGTARTNLQDAADRNMDSKNGGALSALLQSVKRQYPAKGATA
jgi:hypothetical protein